MKNEILKDILSKITIDQIAAEHLGELPEVCGDDFTAFYGNRELIVYLADDEEPHTFSVDIYGGRKILVAN